jgi:hypothetical protein
MTCEFILWYVHYWTNAECELRSLNRLLEQGLFKPEKGESQMWGQRPSHYATVVRTHLLAKVHQLQSSIKEVGCLQSHPLNHLDKHLDLMGKASNKLGRFIE